MDQVFLYSTVTLFRDAANIFKYDIRTDQTTQITKLKNEFARNFSISPDGKRIVFERCSAIDDYKNVDLWTMNMNGGNSRLLVKNALSLSRSK